MSDGRDLLNAWTAVVVFAALTYLGAGVFKSAFIASFVFVSCSIGFGRRWLIPGGFCVSVIGIGVALGLPHPANWFDLARTIHVAFVG